MMGGGGGGGAKIKIEQGKQNYNKVSDIYTTVLLYTLIDKIMNRNLVKSIVQYDECEVIVLYCMA